MINEISHPNIPTSGNSAELLARVYGNGTSPSQFAANLPSDAQVIDFGAGRSNFGSEIACRRTDITWVNMDIRYNNSRRLKSLRDGAPENVKFAYGDVLTPVGRMDRGKYDRAYSFDLVPPLLRVERGLGERAVHAMLQQLKPNGTLSLGPTNAEQGVSERWRSTHLSANATDQEIDDALDALTGPKINPALFEAMALSGVNIEPRDQFEPGKKGRVISNIGSEGHYPLLSPRGILLAGKLATGLLRS